MLSKCPSGGDGVIQRTDKQVRLSKNLFNWKSLMPTSTNARSSEKGHYCSVFFTGHSEGHLSQRDGH